MSHGDRIDHMPEGFEVLAGSKNSPVAAMADVERRRFGVQFHPEVAHTPDGSKIIGNFLFRICGCDPSWTMASFVRKTVKALKEDIGGGEGYLRAFRGGGFIRDGGLASWGYRGKPFMHSCGQRASEKR